MIKFNVCLVKLNLNFPTALKIIKVTIKRRSQFIINNITKNKNLSHKINEINTKSNKLLTHKNKKIDKNVKNKERNKKYYKKGCKNNYKNQNKKI
jgi:hypothetical protein